VPLADRRRIYEWIDAMIPYYPTSDYAHLEAKSNRDKWGHPDRKELLPWFTMAFCGVQPRVRRLPRPGEERRRAG
jgi:hypothetical protein